MVKTLTAKADHVSVRRIAAFGALMFCIILLLQAVYFDAYLKRMHASKDWVRHTHVVIDELDRLIAQVRAAESAQRGYIITGDDAFLRQGEQDHVMRRSLARITALTHDNPSQQRRIAQIERSIAVKLAYIRATIDTRRTRGMAAAIAQVKTQEGVRLMRDVDDKIGAMLAEESRLLDERDQRDRRALRQFVTFTLGALLSSYAVLLLATALIIRSHNRLRRAEEQTKASEARFERAVRGSHDGIWEWDIQNDRIYYSPRFLDLLGYAPGEIGTQLADWAPLRHPDDNPLVMKKIEAVFRDRVPYHAEYRLRKKSGDYIWVESRGTAEWDEFGAPIRMSGSLTDVSERKRMESLKHEFVYTVTHELRTPLTALKGAIDVLNHLLGEDMPVRVANMIDIAMRGSDRLMLLINDLLDAGKMESGQMGFDMQATPLAPVLREAVQLNATYADQHGVTFDLREPVVNPVLYLDAGRLQQVLANLLSNAAKFSPRGGVVTLHSICTDSHVRISVTDTGEGIPSHLQPKLFQKFAQGQSDKGGTGLGLNITKTIVERMGGAIGFITETGQGTTFYVDFPLRLV